MNYAAQPAGTAAAQALTNRGDDPDLIAASTYAFYDAIKPLVRHRQLAGNMLASPNSVITALIGGYFLSDDAGVLAGFPATSLPTPVALSDLVAFLEHIGCNFQGKSYQSDVEPWQDIASSGYDEFLEWLQSSDSTGMAPDPRCMLTIAKMYALQPPAGSNAQQNAFSWVRLASYEMLAQPVGDPRGLRRLEHSDNESQATTEEKKTTHTQPVVYTWRTHVRSSLPIVWRNERPGEDSAHGGERRPQPQPATTRRASA